MVDGLVHDVNRLDFTENALDGRGQIDLGRALQHLRALYRPHHQRCHCNDAQTVNVPGTASPT